jgi:peroxiredoxin
VSAKLASGLGITFPLASDEDGVALKAFGVLDPATDIAWPSLYLIESDRTITWRWLADTFRERPEVSEVLAEIDAAKR